MGPFPGRSCTYGDAAHMHHFETIGILSNLPKVTVEENVFVVWFV